jgi:hypothetical protein
MTQRTSRSRTRWRAPALLALAVDTAVPVLAATSASAAPHGFGSGGALHPGDLLISGSVYTGTAGLLTPGVTVLPPGCTSGCVTATAAGQPGRHRDHLGGDLYRQRRW